MPVRELDHEALPGGIVIPLAGVLGGGEAVSRRELERAESVGVADPGVVLGLLGREVVHEEADVVGDRARCLGVGVVRRPSCSIKLALVDEAWAAALRIPNGKGDAEVEPPWEALVLPQVTMPAQMTPRHMMTKRWPRWP